MRSICGFTFIYYAEKAVTIQFVECLSVNREKENIEVHLNGFGYCSHCAGISPCAEISAETLIILYGN